MVAAADLAAELGAHDLLAVADAEHGHAGVEYLLPARAGFRPASTLSGPPERMMPRGSKARMRAGSTLNGQISQ